MKAKDEKWVEDQPFPANEEQAIANAIYFYHRSKIKDKIIASLKQAEEYLSVSELPSDVYNWRYDAIKLKIYPDIQDDSTYEYLEVKRDKISCLKEPRKTEEIIFRLRFQLEYVYEYLLDNEYPYILGFVQSNAGNAEQARDVFQEALTIIIERINCNKLRINSSFSAYLYSVARNLWIKQMKEKKKHEKVVEYMAYYDEVEQNNEFEKVPDNYELICTAIEKLGDSCRQLLEKYYFEKKDWRTICRILGYSSPESARNQKYKCLERIREQVKRSQLQ